MKLSEYLSKPGNLPEGAEVSLEQLSAVIGKIEATGVTLLVNDNKEADYRKRKSPTWPLHGLDWACQLRGPRRSDYASAAN